MQFSDSAAVAMNLINVDVIPAFNIIFYHSVHGTLIMVDKILYLWERRTSLVYVSNRNKRELTLNVTDINYRSSYG